MKTEMANKILKKFFKSLKERGIKGTLHEIISRIIVKIRISADRKFDRRFRVDTSGIVGILHLDINDDQKRIACQYEPTPVPALKFMLKMLDIDHSKYTFIDFGSGKGRVLLLASEYPYKKIIGVEFSERLHSIAKDNFKTWNNPKKKCFNLESICMDVGDFKLPNDPLILFFFNPFKDSIITKVINNIQESLKDNPRPIQILYYGSNRDFINILGKLNFTCKEIYARRPFSAMKKYKGLHFSSVY